MAYIFFVYIVNAVSLIVTRKLVHKNTILVLFSLVEINNLKYMQNTNFKKFNIIIK